MTKPIFKNTSAVILGIILIFIIIVLALLDSFYFENSSLYLGDISKNTSSIESIISINSNQQNTNYYQVDNYPDFTDFITQSTNIPISSEYILNDKDQIISYGKSSDNKLSLSSLNIKKDKKMLSLNWQVEIDGQSNTPLVCGQGTVFLVTNDNRVLAFYQKNGSIKWKVEISNLGKSISPPIITDNNLIIATNTGEIIFINYRTGELEDRLFLPNKKAIIGLAYENNNLIILTSAGEVYSFDTLSRKIIWGYASKQLNLESDTISLPVIHDQHLFIKGDRAIIDLNLMTGQVNWQKSFSKPIIGSLASDEKYLYLATFDNIGLQALELDDGDLVWSLKNWIKPEQKYSFIVTTDKIFISSYGQILEVEKSTGEILKIINFWKSFPKYAGNITDFIIQDSIFIGLNYDYSSWSYYLFAIH